MNLVVLNCGQVTKTAFALLNFHATLKGGLSASADSTGAASLHKSWDSQSEREKKKPYPKPHDFDTALSGPKTATAGSDVVQSGRPIFDDFFQHLWPYIGNNTANVVFQMVKRLWLIRIDQ
ncbi:hypothetical protein TNCV_3757471 [Trichonephila clavipes]|nr:hypothetical protein TNCV_3757471 [Trichonephila clavipes]